MSPVSAYFLGLATVPALLVVIGVVGVVAMNRASGKRRAALTAGSFQPGLGDPDKAETPPPAVPQGDGDSTPLTSWVASRNHSYFVPVHGFDHRDQIALADAYIAHLDSIRKRALHEPNGEDCDD